MPPGPDGYRHQDWNRRANQQSGATVLQCRSLTSSTRERCGNLFSSPGGNLLALPRSFATAGPSHFAGWVGRDHDRARLWQSLRRIFPRSRHGAAPWISRLDGLSGRGNGIFRRHSHHRRSPDPLGVVGYPDRHAGCNLESSLAQRPEGARWVRVSSGAGGNRVRTGIFRGRAYGI